MDGRREWGDDGKGGGRTDGRRERRWRSEVEGGSVEKSFDWWKMTGVCVKIEKEIKKKYRQKDVIEVIR